MGFFTHVTTNVRGKRAAVILYAMVLVGLIVYATFILAPLVEEGGRLAKLHPAGISEAFFEASRHATVVLILAVVLALILVVTVFRGRVDDRLTALSLWLVLANALILTFYVIAFWWYYGAHSSR